MSALDKSMRLAQLLAALFTAAVMVSCVSSHEVATPNANDLRATARAINKQQRDLGDAQREVLDQAKRQEEEAKTAVAATAQVEQMATAEIRATEVAKIRAMAEMQATATAIQRVALDAQATTVMQVTEAANAQATITAESLKAIALQTVVAEKTQAPLRITATAIALESERQQRQLQNDLSRVFSFLPLILAVAAFAGWGVLTLSKAIRAKKKIVERVIVASMVSPTQSPHVAHSTTNSTTVILEEDTQWEMSIEDQE